MSGRGATDRHKRGKTMLHGTTSCRIREWIIITMLPFWCFLEKVL